MSMGHQHDTNDDNKPVIMPTGAHTAAQEQFAQKHMTSSGHASIAQTAMIMMVHIPDEHVRGGA